MLLPLLFLYLGDNLDENQGDNNGIPRPDKMDTLENLFDIRLGLIEDRYLHLTQESESPVHFITVKSFTDVPEKDKTQVLGAELSQLKKLDPSWLEKLKQQSENQRIEGKGIRDNKKRVLVKSDSILAKDDYLISVRGRPTGYSLLNVNEIETHNFVPTHHFIRLRPLKTFTRNNLYAHLIMNQLVKFELSASFESKLADENSNSSYASFNSVKVEELRNLSIKYHSDVVVQQQVYEMFASKYAEWFNQNLAFEQFQQDIYSSIKTKENGK
jgi:hypothetical protein